MHPFLKGLSAQASFFSTRTRPTNTLGIRPPLRRARQPRRNQSSETSKREAHTQKKAAEDGSPVKEDPSSSPSPPPGAAAVAAGAATTVAPRRGFGVIIEASFLGKFGRWYARVQSKRPYMTSELQTCVV